MRDELKKLDEFSMTEDYLDQLIDFINDVVGYAAMCILPWWEGLLTDEELSIVKHKIDGVEVKPISEESLTFKIEPQEVFPALALKRLDEFPMEESHRGFLDNLINDKDTKWWCYPNYDSSISEPCVFLNGVKVQGYASINSPPEDLPVFPALALKIRDIPSR